MYNHIKAPKSNINALDNKLSFKIPQHIFKLLTKLLNSDGKTKIESILRQFSSTMKYDDNLKNIFHYFDWAEETKTFNKEIKIDDLVSKLEKEYDFSLNENINEEKSNNDAGI